MAAQPLQRGLATLDQLVVGGLRGVRVALGDLAQLVGGQPLAQLAELRRQVLLQLGQAGTALLDARLGVGAGLFGALAQGGDDLVDRSRARSAAPTAASSGALRSSMVGWFLAGLFFAMLVFPFQRFWLIVEVLKSGWSGLIQSSAPRLFR